MRSFLSPIILILLAFPCISLAAPVTTHGKIDPQITRALQSGIQGIPRRGSLPPTPGSARVLLELNNDVTPNVLARLTTAGVKLNYASGAPLTYRGFIPATITQTSLGKLAAMPEIKRAMLIPQAGPPPLDHSAELIGLAGARGARPALDLLTGQGVVLADSDTNVDIFHPTFFRGDAGYFAWIDVNQNGVFNPGIDAIDLDGNGQASADEIVSVLRAETLYSWSTEIAPARSSLFDPAIDWLYLDQNQNHQRDFGVKAGFDESTPAYGEPLFVPDDLNRNGKLDPGEKVIRLGTSKFRKLYVDLSQGGSIKRIFERGVDLISHKTSYFNGKMYGYSDALHGTGVLSIAAGDLPLAGRRWVGMAPDAELLLIWEYSDLPIGGTTWALGEHAQAMLYEMCPWTGVALDGSDPLSKLIDSSTVNDGVSHTCPVGDQAGAQKHTSARLPAGQTIILPFVNPDGLEASYVQLSLYVRGAGAQQVKVTLIEPGDTPVVHPLNQNCGTNTYDCTLADGAYCQAAVEMTERGTCFTDVLMWQNDPASPIPAGNWALELVGGASDATFDALLSDDASGFSPGVAWEDSIANDQSTLGVPSTADHCIAVAAHTGHLSTTDEPWFYAYPPNGVGQVRDYSPWGPRIDGMQKPDVAAPDNPWAAVPYDHPFATSDDFMPHGAFGPFGGTSGAAPHVLGVAALLMQAGLQGDAVRTAMQQGAIVDQVTGAVPNDRYGYGRLSAAGAFGVAAGGAPPTFSLVAEPATAPAKSKVKLIPTASAFDGSTSGLEIKWDDNYDGTWDLPYAPLATREVQSEVEGTMVYKARVRDGAGQFSEALVQVTFTKPIPGGGCGCHLAHTQPTQAPLIIFGLVLALLMWRRSSDKRA